LAGVVALSFATTGVLAQGTLLPEGIFNPVPANPKAPASISADLLSYDSNSDVITAEGHVVLGYENFVVSGDRLVFNKKTNDANFVGSVVIHDNTTGTVYTTDNLKLVGAMKKGFTTALTITTKDGGYVTATDANYTQALTTILNNSTYTPCGKCVNAKGQTIGWKVKAARMTYDNKTRMVYLDQPHLELLGIPVAWAPWFAMPDPSDPNRSGIRTPSIDSSDEMGYAVGVPYFIPVGDSTDVTLTGTALTRQGLMGSAEVVQRFQKGSIDLKASGLYQLDRSAFAGTVGDLDWRGAIQSSGQFVPTAQWTTGWSYTKFTDAAYLVDYHLQTNKDLTNEVYATHVSDNFYGDFRLQQFNLLGNVTDAAQNQQALAVPNVHTSGIFDLGPDKGRVELSSTLLGVLRGQDQVQGPMSAVTGYQEGKVHTAFNADWQRQMIAPGGVVATPYLGVRGDIAYYDGSSPLLPDASTLLNAAPTAAIDVRYPLFATLGSSVHVIEPIAQLAYTASPTSQVGITNDDAQSFVFDDTNLFSYDRFSGSDLIDTGLRANVGFRYQANFADGSWFNMLAGQSFHLAGQNAFAIDDTTQTTSGSGLAPDASYIVLGANGSVNGLQLGAKALVDPSTPRIASSGVGVNYSIYGYSAGATYLYVAANPSIGVLQDQQEIAGIVGLPIPFADYVPYANYWHLTAHGAWDLAANSYLEVGGGAQYDDGYLTFGGQVTRTGPTNTSPNDTQFTANFKLKGPSGGTFGH
jgi:LPS-assembly protein